MTDNFGSKRASSFSRPGGKDSKAKADERRSNLEVRINELSRVVLAGVPKGVLDHYEIVGRFGREDRHLRWTLVPRDAKAQESLSIDELTKFMASMAIIRQLREEAEENSNAPELERKIFDVIWNATVHTAATKSDVGTLIGHMTRLEENEKKLDQFNGPEIQQPLFLVVKDFLQQQVKRANRVLHEAKLLIRKGETPHYLDLCVANNCSIWFFEKYVKNPIMLKPSDSLIRFLFPKDHTKGIRVRIEEFKSLSLLKSLVLLSDKMKLLILCWIRHGSIVEGKQSFIVPPPYGAKENFELSQLAKDGNYIAVPEGPLGPMVSEYNNILMILRGITPLKTPAKAFWESFGLIDFKTPGPEVPDFRRQAIIKLDEKTSSYPMILDQIAMIQVRRSLVEDPSEEEVANEKKRLIAALEKGEQMVYLHKEDEKGMERMDPLDEFPGKTPEEKRLKRGEAFSRWSIQKKDLPGFAERTRRQRTFGVSQSELTSEGKLLLKHLKQKGGKEDFLKNVIRLLTSFRSAPLQALAANTVRFSTEEYDTSPLPEGREEDGSVEKTLQDALTYDGE